MIEGEIDFNDLIDDFLKELANETGLCDHVFKLFLGENICVKCGIPIEESYVY